MDRPCSGGVLFFTLLVFPLFLLAMPFEVQAQEHTVEISMVAATSVAKVHPFAVFGKGEFRAERGAEFVKLHIYADKPIPLSGVEIESCGRKFTDKILGYINFDQFFLKFDPSNGRRVVRKNTKALRSMRSLTLNFQKNQNLCIRAVRFFGKDGIAHTIKTPRLISGKASATSTLSPRISYGVMNIFDSRFEYAWSSNAKLTGVSLKFSFDRPQRVERIRIWNGYQRSEQHCWANSRVREFRVSGDGGYLARVKLADVMGSQVIRLPKPFTGKNLTLTVIRAYRGNTYQDLLISELRFNDGKEWFMLNPMPSMRAIANKNKKAFRKARIHKVLNRSLEFESASGDSNWIFRFRPDGSLYLQGRAGDDASETSFFALGNYEVKSASARGAHLRIFGSLIKITEFWEDGGD